VRLDLHHRRAVTGKGPVSLTGREFALLAHLMRRSNDVCSREELLKDVWGLGYDPSSNVVDVCVGRLRWSFSPTFRSRRCVVLTIASSTSEGASPIRDLKANPADLTATREARGAVGMLGSSGLTDPRGGHIAGATVDDHKEGRLVRGSHRRA